MRTVTPARATFGAKLTWLLAALFFLAMLIAIAPLVLDTLAQFGVIRGHASAVVFPTPSIVIRDAVPAFVPPVASPEPPQAPLRENAAPAVGVPVSAATAVPVAPVGIKVIVIKPADGGAPIVLRDGYKYRSAP
jgi:hypothetical protein